MRSTSTQIHQQTDFVKKKYRVIGRPLKIPRWGARVGPGGAPWHKCLVSLSEAWCLLPRSRFVDPGSTSSLLIRGAMALEGTFWRMFRLRRLDEPTSTQVHLPDHVRFEMNSKNARIDGSPMCKGRNKLLYSGEAPPPPWVMAILIFEFVLWSLTRYSPYVIGNWGSTWTARLGIIPT